MKNRIIALAVCLLMLVTILSPVTAYAREEDTKTIRVGYFEFPGYHEIYEDNQGTHGRGYGFDFLQLLRRYTNLNYEYVGFEKSWQDMLEMLRSGQIDMVTSARKTSQRKQEKVKIQCHNHMAGVFFDRFGRDISFRAADDDYSEFSVDVNVIPQFYGWILGLGNEVKVVGPSDVVEDMKKHAEEFLAKYR